MAKRVFGKHDKQTGMTFMIRCSRASSMFLPGMTMCALVIAGVAPRIGMAQDADVDPDPVSVKGLLEDTKLYFTAPIRWDAEDWAYFGGALVAIAGSHQLDARVRNHFEPGPNGGVNGGQDKNSLRDALPTVAIIAGTGFFAAFYRDSEGYRETVALLEAGVFSGITAEALGYAAGRDRPDATTSPNRWRAGGDSFPSLHASAAFAVGTVFAESGNDEYRWLRRLIGYGVAGATAYIRVKEDDHWLSDSVAGAALGIATARFMLNREEREDTTSLQIQPLNNGWMIAYSKRFQ